MPISPAVAPSSRVARSEVVKHPRPSAVLFVTWDYWPTAVGGAEHQARLQAEALVARGYSVTVVCPNAAGAVAGIIGGVEVVRLPHQRVNNAGRFAYPVALSRWLLRHGRHFDVVHIHLANRQADLVVLLAALLRRPVYVKVACGGLAGEVAERQAAHRRLKWLALRRAARVQALSDEIRNELLSVGVRASRIVSLPNGVELPNSTEDRSASRRRARERLALPEDKVVVLFLGRVAYHKGVNDLLDVWRCMHPCNAILLIAGSTRTPDVVASLPNLAGVSLLGHVANPRDLLLAADVFVHPSRTDGMSNSVLEALAHGLCTVASRSGATGAMIDHRRSGLLFEPGDRSQLQDALRAVVDSAELRSALAGRARSAVEPFALDLVVGRIEAVYAELVGT